MSFILGVCGFGAPIPPRCLDPMVAAQQALAPDGVTTRAAGAAVFSRGLYRLNPEDTFDEQPFVSEDGLLMVVDARIDNRAELLDRLGLARQGEISDSELLFLVYRAHGEKIGELILGDFAFAAWEEKKRRLTLARDYTGQRPLHFHIGDGFVAFSSMPHGLLAHENVSAEPDSHTWAEFFADIPRSGPRTYFRDIQRVEPGHVVRIDPNGSTSRSYWRAPEGRIEFSSDDQYALALREHLERSTAARLRGVSDAVGAHLSAGLDSSSVATTAALILKERQGRVIAFTGAPRAGFDGPLPRGRIADESLIAARAAALHSNIEHVVVRAEGRSPLEVLRRDSGLFGEPLGLPCNQVWWSAVVESAQERGLRVLLTGEAGNYAFSSGGLPTLAEFVSERQWGRLWREARCLRTSGTRWQGIIGSAFGPWFPEGLWRALQRWKWGRSTSQVGHGLLMPAAQAELPRNADSLSRDRRPELNARQEIARMLQNVDPGVFRKATLARWGVEERDPTTDRALVEYCLSVPPEQLLTNGVTRALPRKAFADRLPPELLTSARGAQGADWYERLCGDDVIEAVNSIDQALGPNKIADLDGIRRLALTWPVSGWENGSVISTYRYALLRSVSAAYFLASFK